MGWADGAGCCLAKVTKVAVIAIELESQDPTTCSAKAAFIAFKEDFHCLRRALQSFSFLKDFWIVC